MKAFLDLPSPWEAIPYLVEAFDTQRVGRVCSFSPCIEQVQLTVNALEAHGFFDIKMFEVLLRTHDVKKISQSGWKKQAVVAKQRYSTNKRVAEEVLEKNTGSAEVEMKEDETLNVESEKVMRKKEIKEVKIEDLFAVTRPSVDMRGHTSYLTFAKYLHISTEETSD